MERVITPSDKIRQLSMQRLIWLVRLLGDIHQPLHVTERQGDRGGMDVILTFNDKPMSLHLFWDYAALETRGFDWGERVEIILQDFADRDRPVTSVDVLAWAQEARRLAKNVAYAYPDDLVIDEDYTDRTLEANDLQLWRAGLRLAEALRLMMQ